MRHNSPSLIYTDVLAKKCRMKDSLLLFDGKDGIFSSGLMRERKHEK